MYNSLGIVDLIKNIDFLLDLNWIINIVLLSNFNIKIDLPNITAPQSEIMISLVKTINHMIIFFNVDIKY